MLRFRSTDSGSQPAPDPPCEKPGRLKLTIEEPTDVVFVRFWLIEIVQGEPACPRADRHICLLSLHARAINP
jgi:hypothetical protein